MLKRLAHVDLRYAVSGSVAAAAFAPYAEARLLVLYADAPDALADAVGLRPARGEGNVLLGPPLDDVVYERTIDRDDVSLVAPAQAAIDSDEQPGPRAGRGGGATRLDGGERRMSGSAELAITTRRALLDAIDALGPLADAVVLVGAQAIYLRTGDTALGLAPSTRDADLAVDRRVLPDDPRIEQAMRAGGFQITAQPGSWVDPAGVPVDLLMPAALSDSGGRRGARIPPHDRRATRRTTGMEAAVVDNTVEVVGALNSADDRQARLRVAGPAALLVAKLHKLGDRKQSAHRLSDKDAHDVYRLLYATPSDELIDALVRLRGDALAGGVTTTAIDNLAELFGDEGALGAQMAGRAETDVANPALVSAQVAALADELLMELRR